MLVVFEGWLQTQSTLVLLVVIIFFIALLSKGADILVEQAVRLAHMFGVSSLVIGATIVSLGTTAPELFVSVSAALQGNSDLALGNGVGSIIADTGLILGLLFLFGRVTINKSQITFSSWWQLGSGTIIPIIALLSLLYSPSPVINSYAGLALSCLLLVYLISSYFNSKKLSTSSSDAKSHSRPSIRQLLLGLLLLALAILMVLLASDILVPSVSELALRLGIAEDIIAATMLAFGTSLPELATAITALRKKNLDLSLGNIMGADTLNSLFVIGVSATAEPLRVGSIFFKMHFPVMLIMLWSLRLLIASKKIAQRAYVPKSFGLFLLVLYLSYIIILYAFNKDLVLY